MSKLAILTIFVIAVVAAHPGHGKAINTEQKSAWTAAFAAKRAHLAAQVKFHTSELLRYENRDAEYEALDSVWAGEGSVVDHFKSTLSVHKEYKTKENDINKVVTVNQNARNPLLAKYNELVRVAYTTKQVRRMQTAEAVTAAYTKWIDTSKSANAAEQAFHHVEFKEFEGQEACMKEAETRMADAATLDEDMRYYFRQCMNKINEEVKKAVVNVADQNRRVGRKDLGKLWMTFAQAGQALVKSENQKAQEAKKAARDAKNAEVKAARDAKNGEAQAARDAKNAAAKAARGKRSLGKQGPMTDSQKAAWKKAFELKDIHQAAQRKFHTSEFERYKNRDAIHVAVDAIAQSDKSESEKFQEIKRARMAGVKVEKTLNKTINANKAARNAPNKAYRVAMRAARQAKRRNLQEDCASDVTAKFQKWYDTSKAANDAETAFHTVEFEEFDQDDACTKEARAKLDSDAEITNRQFAKETIGCYRKVQVEVKRPVINVANNKRKTERKGLRNLWRAYVKAGNPCFKGKRGKATRRQLLAKYQDAVRELKAYITKF
jgi:hypothetical protein